MFWCDYRWLCVLSADVQKGKSCEIVLHLPAQAGEHTVNGVDSANAFKHTS